MANSPTSSSLRDSILSAPPALRQRLLIEFITGQLKEALGTDSSDDIHPRSRFEALGIDSKRALEFKEFLEQEFHCALSTTLLFDYPTPESLAAFIVQGVLGANDTRIDAASAPRPTAATSTGKEDGDVEELMRRKLEKYRI